MPTPDQSLAIGSWTLWAIGLITIGARLVSRRMSLGSFKKYQADDYLMMIALVSFTGVVVSSNQAAINGSNYVEDDVIATMTDEEKADAIWGSKMLLALEQFELGTLWIVKACLLLLYARMTNGMKKERMAVMVLAVYTAIGIIVVEVLYLGVWCTPIYMYWSLPVPDDQIQCKTYRNHMITATIFNISSDLAMLCIPIPIIARARLPLKRKVILCFIFSLGILTVLVAILNRYYNFSTSDDLVFLGWYNGEASTAIMIANIPFCWSLLRTIFSLGPWNTDTKQTGRPSHTATIGGSGATPHKKRTVNSSITRTTTIGVDIEPSESMEAIAQENDEDDRAMELSYINAKEGDYYNNFSPPSPTWDGKPQGKPHVIVSADANVSRTGSYRQI